MPTNYPGALDAFIDPLATNTLASPSHSGLHTNIHDAVEAVEAKVGIGSSTPVAGRVLGSTVTGSSAWAAVPLVDGIAFPATAVASADPNTLDDFEEGSWTPTLQFGGLSAGITYTLRQGFYRRWGDLIWLHSRTLLSSKGTSTGTASIASLPFTGAAVVTSGSIGYYTGFTSMTGVPIVYFNNADNTLAPRQSSATGIAVVSDANFTNTSDLIVAILYRGA